MHLTHANDAPVTFREIPGRDVYVVVCTKNKAVKAGTLTAGKLNLYGQNTTPKITSNMKIGKADLRGTRVTARPKTTGRSRQSEESNHRSQRELSFPGNELLVDATAHSEEECRNRRVRVQFACFKNDGTFSRKPREILWL